MKIIESQECFDFLSLLLRQVYFLETEISTLPFGKADEISGTFRYMPSCVLDIRNSEEETCSYWVMKTLASFTTIPSSASSLT